MILLSRSAADANRDHFFSLSLQWNASGKDHDLAVIGGMDPEELPAGLRMSRQIFCGNIKSPRSIGFLLRNIDAANQGSVHADVGDDVAAFIRHSDVHRLPDFSGLLLGSRDHC